MTEQDGRTFLREGETKTTTFRMWSFEETNLPDSPTTLFIAEVQGKPEYSDFYFREKSRDQERVRTSMETVVFMHDSLLWNNTEPVTHSEEAFYEMMKRTPNA